MENIEIKQSLIAVKGMCVLHKYLLLLLWGYLGFCGNVELSYVPRRCLVLHSLTQKVFILRSPTPRCLCYFSDKSGLPCTVTVVHCNEVSLCFQQVTLP